MTQNCKIEFLDTHIGLTGLVRTETLQRWKIEQDVDNHNEKPCYNVKLLSMSPTDRILELTDETGMTGFIYRSDQSSQHF
jgi:hypothetical protein